jgi:hypothetical protein
MSCSPLAIAATVAMRGTHVLVGLREGVGGHCENCRYGMKNCCLCLNSQLSVKLNCMTDLVGEPKISLQL